MTFITHQLIFCPYLYIVMRKAFQGMRNEDTILPNITPSIRWIARISSIVLVMFIVASFFAVGKGLTLTGLKTSEFIMTVALLGAVLGLLIGWAREGVGGILTIAGLLTFTVVNYEAGGDFSWQIWVLAVPAILFITYWWRTR